MRSGEKWGIGRNGYKGGNGCGGGDLEVEEGGGLERRGFCWDFGPGDKVEESWEKGFEGGLWVEMGKIIYLINF